MPRPACLVPVVVIAVVVAAGVAVTCRANRQSLPSLDRYGQSAAQLRFAGKLAQLYPQDALEQLKVDEILETVGLRYRELLAKGGGAKIPPSKRCIQVVKVQKENSLRRGLRFLQETQTVTRYWLLTVLACDMRVMFARCRSLK